MYMFMMWMTGSQLNVYTIFILQPLIMGPVTAIATMSKRESEPCPCSTRLDR